MSLKDNLDIEICKIKSKGLYREEKFFSGVDFITNDYFSLKESPFYKKSLKGWSNLGSGASRYLGGFSKELKELEEKLSIYYNAKRAFLFPSGYMANLAILSTFPQGRDIILYDENSHASLKDGIRLSLAKSYPFRHLDLEDVRRKVNRLRPKKGHVFLVSESVFSMDGDILPLGSWLRFCEENNAYLILDEAHSVGLLGNKGKGLAYGIFSDYLLCRMVGFGKAFALQGGAILFQNETYASYFAQKARPLIYSTAPHPILCNLLSSAHDFFEIHQEKLWQKLLKKIQDYAYLAKNFGVPANLSHPIQILNFGKEKSIILAKELNKKNIAIKAILPPTVPEGKERIRLVIKRKHKKSDFLKIFSLCKEYA